MAIRTKTKGLLFFINCFFVIFLLKHIHNLAIVGIYKEII